MSKNYKVIMEALVSGKLNEIELPTATVDARTLTLDEIKQIIKEEFKDVKDLEKEANKTKEGAWHNDYELANQIDWIKKLKLKEWIKK